MSTSKRTNDPAIAHVVERQMRNWEIARGQRDSSRPAQEKEVEDFVAISRCVGAGGSRVASLVAERLGWPMFDRKILDEMSGDDGLRHRLYSSMDERDMSWMEEALRAMVEPDFSRNDYFHQLSQTILTLARQSSAVFLGRGADLILPPGMGFRVRLVAPLEECIQSYASRVGLPLSKAGPEVRRLERHRAQFIRSHFGVDVSDPIRYDLVINMARYSAEEAVELILSARKLAKQRK